MSSLNESIFIAKTNQAHFVLDEDLDNVTGDYEVMRIGSGLGKFPGEFQPKRFTLQSWNMDNPDSGPPVPKTAIIDGVVIEFVVAVSNFDYGHDDTVVGDSASLAFAFLVSDGHWDRSPLHPLHQQQSATSYGATCMSSATPLSLITDSEVELPASFPFTDVLAGYVLPKTFPGGDEVYHQTYGNTIEIPANTVIKKIKFRVIRQDTSGSNPDVNLNVYTLSANERHRAIDSLLATSSGIPYNDLSLNEESDGIIVFQYDTPIAAESTARWVGCLLEGDFFTADNFANHRLTVSGGIVQPNHKKIYFPEPSLHNGSVVTSGSLLFASKHPSALIENSFVGLYYSKADCPAMMASGQVEEELNTPFRRLSLRLPYTDPENLVGIVGSPISFGSVGEPYLADHALEGDIVAELQNRIDDPTFNPATGNSWIGMVMDKLRGGGVRLYEFHGPANTSGFDAIKIKIHWHERSINTI